jgi:hypothetical protein
VPSAAVTRWIAIGAGALLTVTAAWALMARYATRNPYGAFVGPARRFLEAGLALDSIALVRMEASPEAIAWALETGRREPARLRALLHGIGPVGGRRTGDGALVLFNAAGEFGSCGAMPLAVTFRGLPAAMRVARVSAGCEPRR